MDLIDMLKQVFDAYVERQGWDEDSQIEILLSVLAEQKMHPSQLASLLAGHAASENTDEETEDEETD